MYEKNRAKDISKVKGEIRKSQLIEQPIRYVDMTEKDILSNKDDKVFYSILSDSLIFYNAEKYVGLIKKCHR